jgi:hypothetical protein
MFEVDTAADYVDLLDRLNTFLTAKGSAFGLAYSGTGTGTLTDYSGGASSIAETFTITATSSSSFDVVGSVSGSIGPATVGTPFAHAKIEFTITAGGTAFIAGDEFLLSTAPKWTAHRKTLGARVLATQGNSGSTAAQNIVDGKTTQTSMYWAVAAPVTLPQIVEFTLFEAETITQYQMAAFSSSGYPNMPKTWKFQYDSGGSVWVDLDSHTDYTGWTPSGIVTFTIGSPVSATKYRLYITAIPSTTIHIGAVRLLRASGVDAAFSQVIWEAPGNDGDEEIFCGAHAFERQDADYFNWELSAQDGYVAGALWAEQTGFHGKCYLPLWDASIPYWFIADGRRVIVIAKIDIQYEVAYLGLHNPYFSPDQLPYPMALGGSMAHGQTIPGWDSTLWRWNNTGYTHRAFTHSDPGNPAIVYTEYFQLRARDWDGLWIGFEATKQDIITGTPGVSQAIVWPYRCGLSLLDPNLDGSYALWPIMLMDATPNTLGNLSGVACVSGQDITAETLITIGSVDWIVVPNINRTDRDDFFAVALD